VTRPLGVNQLQAEPDLLWRGNESNGPAISFSDAISWFFSPKMKLSHNHQFKLDNNGEGNN